VTSIVRPDDIFAAVASIKDRESLALVSRLVDAQLTVMESQTAMLRQVQAALKERQQGMK